MYFDMLNGFSDSVGVLPIATPLPHDSDLSHAPATVAAPHATQVKIALVPEANVGSDPGGNPPR